MKPPGIRVPARSFCRGPCSCRRCVRITERPTKLHARRTGLVASTSSPIGPRSRMLMAKLADGGLCHRSLWRSSRPMARRSAGRINALARLSQFAGNDCRSRATIDEVRQAFGRWRTLPRFRHPQGRLWFCTITAMDCPPSIRSRGYSATREQVIADFKAQWLGS